MDARLEIAIAGKNRRRDKIILHDNVLNRGRERPGVSDAGCAAITDRLESEPVQIGLQARFLEVVGDHPRSWGER